jgi:2-oxoacid:acceptor oxidoreductase delta subunit (pyruvate/2-ketoisovalerate family)
MSKEKLATGAVSDRPGSSSSNKTGSWRTFKPRVTDKCTGCGICAQFCPEGCINIRKVKGKKNAVIDYDYCKGCLICVGQCPSKAIESGRER